jgi:hypothetical protein
LFLAGAILAILALNLAALLVIPPVAVTTEFACLRATPALALSGAGIAPAPQPATAATHGPRQFIVKETNGGVKANLVVHARFVIY